MAGESSFRVTFPPSAVEMGNPADWQAEELDVNWTREERRLDHVEKHRTPKGESGAISVRVG